MNYKIEIRKGNRHALFYVMAYRKSANILVEPKDKGWKDPQIIVNVMGWTPIQDVANLIEVMELAVAVSEGLKTLIDKGSFRWPLSDSTPLVYTSATEFIRVMAGNKPKPGPVPKKR